MPYGLDNQGRPIFFISTTAMHTQNLQADPRASLFVTEPDASGDPVGSSRVTLIGSALRIPVTELADARAVYLTSYPDSRRWVDFEDFLFYRLNVIDVYYVGGFGVTGWVTASDYSQAQSDPLAEHKNDIMQHIHINEQIVRHADLRHSANALRTASAASLYNSIASPSFEWERAMSYLRGDSSLQGKTVLPGSAALRDRQPSLRQPGAVWHGVQHCHWENPQTWHCSCLQASTLTKIRTVYS
jgi:hypothetical protein